MRESNVPIGLFRAASYQSAGFQLSPGDRVILVTAVVNEAENPTGDSYGDERLEASAATGMGADQLFASIRRFFAGQPLTDDCTVWDWNTLAIDR